MQSKATKCTPNNLWTHLGAIKFWDFYGYINVSTSRFLYFNTSVAASHKFRTICINQIVSSLKNFSGALASRKHLIVLTCFTDIGAHTLVFQRLSSLLHIIILCSTHTWDSPAKWKWSVSNECSLISLIFKRISESCMCEVCVMYVYT